MQWSPVRSSTQVVSCLASNIIIEWKQMEVTNTLAYYDMSTITSINSFIVQDPQIELIVLVICVVFVLTRQLRLLS
jgi:hypothetical protein